MTRTLMACLSCLTRTHCWVPYMRLLLSNFCIYFIMLLFSFSSLVTAGHLKKEKENNSTKTLTAEAQYIGLESLGFSLYMYKLTLAGWHYL